MLRGLADKVCSIAPPKGRCQKACPIAPHDSALAEGQGAMAPAGATIVRCQMVCPIASGAEWVRRPPSAWRQAVGARDSGNAAGRVMWPGNGSGRDSAPQRSLSKGLSDSATPWLRDKGQWRLPVPRSCDVKWSVR
jgi:hypothetical protein